jgi:DNA-binding NarL/FixJ family response regulator
LAIGSHVNESAKPIMIGRPPAASLPSATAQSRKRILLGDDHPIFRRGIAALISTCEDFEVVAEAATPQEVLSKVRDLPVDVAVLDLTFDGMSGLELTKQVRAEKPEVAIVLVSMHDEELYAIRALRSGAQAYVMKREDPSVLITALRKVSNGDIYVSPNVADSLVYKAVRSDGNSASPLDSLSDRQLEVLQLFGEGHSTQEVAKRLQVSAKTVETHRMHIKEKLNFASATEMVRFAISWVRLQSGAPQGEKDRRGLLRSAPGA